MEQSQLTNIFMGSFCSFYPIELQETYITESGLQKTKKGDVITPYGTDGTHQFGSVGIAHYTDNTTELFVPSDTWGRIIPIAEIKAGKTVPTSDPLPVTFKSLKDFPDSNKLLLDLVKVVRKSKTLEDISEYLICNAEKIGITCNSKKSPWKKFGLGKTTTLCELIAAYSSQEIDI